MKRSILLISVLCLLVGCTNEKSTHQETVTTYYTAFHAGDYNQIKTVINDSITIVSGDYVMPFTKDSFYEHFTWDSIFQPTYKIIQLEEQNDQVIATVASSSLRYKFLKNDPLSFRYKFSFNEGEISKLEEMELPGTDWNVWQKERDSLVSWVSKHHPDLDEFINDLTMQGAIQYLKAVELYQNK